MFTFFPILTIFGHFGHLQGARGTRGGYLEGCGQSQILVYCLRQITSFGHLQKSNFCYLAHASVGQLLVTKRGFNDEYNFLKTKCLHFFPFCQFLAYFSNFGANWLSLGRSKYHPDSPKSLLLVATYLQNTNLVHPTH